VEERDLVDAPGVEPRNVVEDHEHRKEVDERDQARAEEVERHRQPVLELRPDLRADQAAPEEKRLNHPGRPAAAFRGRARGARSREGAAPTGAAARGTPRAPAPPASRATRRSASGSPRRTGVRTTAL